LDAIVSAYMENDFEPGRNGGARLQTEDVRRVVEMIHRSEYKRRQAPIGIRITHRGFGKDWRYRYIALPRAVRIAGHAQA